MEHRLRTSEGYFQLIGIYCVHTLFPAEFLVMGRTWKTSLPFRRDKTHMCGTTGKNIEQCETLWGEFHLMCSTARGKGRLTWVGTHGQVFWGCGTWCEFGIMAGCEPSGHVCQTVETVWAKIKPQERKVGTTKRCNI